MLHEYAHIDSVPVALVGGSGYAGNELRRLLKRHPYTELVAEFGRTAGPGILPIDHLTQYIDQIDTLFLATPVDTSAQWVSRLINEDICIVDLSGAFRLSEGDTQYRKQQYHHWYQWEHPCPTQIDQFIYGLVPWNKPTRQTPYVANPGCYATAILMALLPLLKSRVLDPTSLVIDAKSGTTGAGKKASSHLLFSEVEGECLPYRVGEHQHLPEISQTLFGLTGIRVDPVFTTHLLNTRRGIIVSLYGKLSGRSLASDIDEAYEACYKDYPLVKWSRLDSQGPQNRFNLSLKGVVGSGHTHIFYKVIGERLYLFSLIDNLLKGAASQAIENFNMIHGWQPQLSVEELEALP